MSSLARLWIRDWQIQLQNIAYTLMPVVFYFTVVSIFAVSDKIHAGVIWSAILLAVVLSLQNLFRDDYSNGVFSYLLLSPTPLPIFILGKILFHWLTTQLPMIILTPILIADSSLADIAIMLLSISIGSFALCFVGALIASLTIALPQGGLLLSVLSIPLYTPILMLGLSASYASVNSLPVGAYICLLLACALLACCFVPLLVSAVIKVNMQ